MADRNGPLCTVDQPVGPLLERMTQADFVVVPVTDPEGHLLGLLEREHLERAVVRPEAAEA
ncbi:hypothetical protein BFF78_02295 [Streptomyces fodineus]|uniref:CBS domain-containing protein n=1 Tax=Streptomyces fodineus TaxID=1904616 RepID=A0A1D7Y3C2_9ACTN|nr:hypothetical protein [Streptomyces fodineus]AOR30056.1 hypothetical protein BFF78_02295 [Streptomyces fodineus]